ncbi:MAG: hypothetical protein U9P38_01855 [Campylobacterota bacterium]|nr:hypothetical protein [Campylobacterota bacterium]
MFKKVLFLFSITTSLFGEFEYRVENSNFTISQDEFRYNYDRLRFRGDFIDENYFTTVIADIVHYYGGNYLSSDEFSFIKQIQSDTPIKTETSFKKYADALFYAKLYRFYLGYEDDTHRTVIGLQNISMGVGRVWTPTDIFNPKNIYSIEPDETFGVFALSYTNHLNDSSDIEMIVSIDEEKKPKYAGIYKTFFQLGDFALDFIYSPKTVMLGGELEINIGESGVEGRVEVAYIKNDIGEFSQIIMGVDYGFLNGLNLIVETLYSSKTFSYTELLLNYDSEIISNMHYSSFYTAVVLSYSFNIFLDTSFIYIESFNDKNSRFLSPTVSYTIDDYNSILFGATINSGDSYYLKYSLIF